MPDAPAPEIPVDAALVRRLLADQAGGIAHAAELPLHLADEGWDNQIWRLGEGWAVRLPRRRIAASLIADEQRWLPVLAPRITAASGLELPVPAVAGRPSDAFPWPWSVVPWIEGEPGIGVRRAARGRWALPLARALRSLHQPAPPEHPTNPFRGVPLSERDPAMRDRLDRLGAAPIARDEVRAARAAWNDALAAPAWSGPAVWIHGDLHPGNLLVRRGRLAAVIDFGDLTAGDPAYDLAIAWLAFDIPAREEFINAIDAPDAALWTRARGWAAAVATMLLLHSDDRPDYRALGAEALRALVPARG